MEYLIDTHIFIWIFSEPERIKPHIKRILDNPDVQLLISPIIFYEIQLKRLAGKLSFELELKHILDEEYFQVLNINMQHTIATYDLPLIHKDPFDRILIAQSLIENIPLITADKEIKKYDFPFISA